jgi:hypothetical protein
MWWRKWFWPAYRWKKRSSSMLPQAKPDRSSVRASGRTTISAIAPDQLAKGFAGRGFGFDRCDDILEGSAGQDQPGRDDDVVGDLAQCREVVLKGVLDEARFGDSTEISRLPKFSRKKAS